MVQISTLFHWVDGFNESEIAFKEPFTLDAEFVDSFLNHLLDPLIFDPGDELVAALLQKI
jgi:hypothetical protein